MMQLSLLSNLPKISIQWNLQRKDNFGNDTFVLSSDIFTWLLLHTNWMHKLHYITYIPSHYNWTSERRTTSEERTLWERHFCKIAGSLPPVRSSDTAAVPVLSLALLPFRNGSNEQLKAAVHGCFSYLVDGSNSVQIMAGPFSLGLNVLSSCRAKA